jgi:hypothetical protein
MERLLAGQRLSVADFLRKVSMALSINDAGQIVGSVVNKEGWDRATLFDPTGAGNNIDLNTLIDPASGWMELFKADNRIKT